MHDEELDTLINKEGERQKSTLNLIASENYPSQEVMDIVGSLLMNKYSEGYPGKRYYPGNMYYDAIENRAIELGKKVFGLGEEWHLNVQPYSGSPANLAIYSALLKPGETLMAMSLASGGHLSHGHKVSLTGTFWKSVHYGVDEKSGLINYEEVQRIAEKEHPKVIISGFTAYPRKVNFEAFGKIAKSVGAYHVADISHVAGLVAGDVHPSPFPYADVVMTTTHKTLRGPRGAIIFCHKELALSIDRAVFPGLQGGPHNNITAAKAQAFFEALEPSFKDYARQIVLNSKALALELMDAGFALITGGTDTHMILIDLKNVRLGGLDAEQCLEAISITTNRNSIPGDTSPFKPQGLRLGTAAVTTRGMKEGDMKKIAEFIYRALFKTESMEILKEEVEAFISRFPLRR